MEQGLLQAKAIWVEQAGSLAGKSHMERVSCERGRVFFSISAHRVVYIHICFACMHAFHTVSVCLPAGERHVGVCGTYILDVLISSGAITQPQNWVPCEETAEKLQQLQA